MRWMAVLCTLIFVFASTAQAAHIHGSGAAAGVHKVQAPGRGSKSSTDEEHCPLCVSVHWAVPTVMLRAPAPGTVLVALAGSCAEVHGARAWHFARFSRPPPVSSLVLS